MNNTKELCGGCRWFALMADGDSKTGIVSNYRYCCVRKKNDVCLRSHLILPGETIGFPVKDD